MMKRVIFVSILAVLASCTSIWAYHQTTDFSEGCLGLVSEIVTMPCRLLDECFLGLDGLLYLAAPPGKTRCVPPPHKCRPVKSGFSTRSLVPSKKPPVALQKMPRPSAPLVATPKEQSRLAPGSSEPTAQVSPPSEQPALVPSPYPQPVEPPLPTPSAAPGEKRLFSAPQPEVKLAVPTPPKETLEKPPQPETLTAGPTVTERQPSQQPAKPEKRRRPSGESYQGPCVPVFPPIQCYPRFFIH